MLRIYIVISLVIGVPTYILPQLSGNYLEQVKQMNNRQFISIELSILSARLSSGSYQNESGKLEFPIDIYLDEKNFICFDVYLNTEDKNLTEKIEIIKDEIVVVFGAIYDILNKEMTKSELKDCIKGRLFNNFSPIPIGIWKGENYFENK
jgi:hypothetical protein